MERANRGTSCEWLNNNYISTLKLFFFIITFILYSVQIVIFDVTSFKIFVFEKVPNVICPGGEQQCPTGQTCCPLSSHEYGCCPLPKAVCCSDHKHCCPKGTTCIAGICFRGAEIVKIYSKITATKVSSKIKLFAYK